MTSSKPNAIILTILCSLILAMSCKNDDKKTTEKTELPLILRKDTATEKTVETIKTAPIINITDTIAVRSNVIYIKDSASTSLGLSQKLAQIYGVKLAGVIKQNKLKTTGAPIAWYRTQRAPFFFEAGLPVDKKPARLPKNMFYKTIGGDSAIVAHFYGPYDQTAIAYEALNDWLKDNAKKLHSPAYEIYVSDPIDKNGNTVDPYRVQTDIIFPHN